MQTTNMTNTNLLTTTIVNELKKLGIKHKIKKIKLHQVHKGQQNARIFGQALPLLKFTDAFLENGTVVQVPKFIADAASCILEQVEVEGIFRKAGSTATQREIRESLEAGLPLDKSYRVIDIACILSYFFRKLPEPLIPTSLHETLVRCLLVDDSTRVHAIQLACLLLPTVHTHTLAYFMQFLHTVSAHADKNKMNAENLARVLAPTVMPNADVKSPRFTNHINLVKVLILNAKLIGTIPNYLNNLLRNTNIPTPCPAKLLKTPQRPIDKCSESGCPSKKKKRRSDMFNGLRKIVGSAIGSSENLDSSTEAKPCSSNASSNSQKLPLNLPLLRPSIISTQKRKLQEPVTVSSAKKTETKQTQIRSGGNKHIKSAFASSAATLAMERRWSLVSTGLSMYKKKETSSRKSCCKVLKEELLMDPPAPLPEPTPTTESGKDMESKLSELENILKNIPPVDMDIQDDNSVKDAEIFLTPVAQAKEYMLTDPAVVQNEFEKTLVKNAALTCRATEQLAQSLSKGLKIRRSVDQQVVRSPSARKIGTLRRKSQERVRSSRMTLQNSLTTSECTKDSSFSKNNIKRGRLNLAEMTRKETPLREQLHYKQEMEFESWMPAETFFQTPKQLSTNYSDVHMQSPHTVKPSATVLSVEMNKHTQTPMLPPKSLPRKYATPSSVSKLSQRNKLELINRQLASTPIQEENGRTSISLLRTQNAGMVLAKTKLFNNLAGETPHRFKSESKILPLSINRAVKKTDTPVGMATKEALLSANRDTKKSTRYMHTPLVLNPKSINFAHIQKESPNRVQKRSIANKKPQSTLQKHKVLLNEIMNENMVVPSKLNRQTVRTEKTSKETNSKPAITEGMELTQKLNFRLDSNGRIVPQVNKARHIFK